MLTALYYPYVTMSPGLVKNALFLWDKIEYIVPYSDFDPWYEDSKLSEAVKSFATPRVPSKEEKEQTNQAIIELLKLGLPDWFYIENIPANHRYKFYSEKLDSDTWRMLKKENLAEDIGDGFDTSAPLGLTIMSILADCCAGTEKRLITDEATSYSALDRYLTTIGGGELGKFDDESERLVTLSLKVMNLENVSLSRLIALREKEKTSSGAYLRNLRHGYLKKIEDYADKLSKAKSKQDTEEIKRVFEQEMRDDFNLLKDELKDEAKKVLFSKELATAAISLAGTFFEPTYGLVVAGGALYKKKIEYRSVRNKTLSGHAMSWLYSIKRFQFY